MSDATATSVSPVTPDPGARGERYARAARLLAMFAGGQATVQILNLVAGLILIRVLTKDAYAQFTLSNSVLSIMGGLIEFGFAPAIVALVAERIHDRQLIGKLLRSASVYRDRLLIIVAIPAAIALVAMGMSQGWHPFPLAMMAVVVTVTTFYHGRVAYYTAPLRIHRQMGLIYVPQALSVVVKIAAFLVFYSLGWLGALMALAVQMVVTGFVAHVLRRSARPLYEPVRRVDPEVHRRMRRHIAPQIPTHLFTVFQGNILIILVTLIGTSDNIAEIGALSRLAQLFAFAWALHVMIVLPWIARIPRERLLPSYLLAATYPVAITALAVSFSFLFPGVLMLILGPNYAHLEKEVGWMVLAGGIHFIGGALFHVHFARGWLYWWSAVAQIIGTLSVQIAGIILLDLSQTMDAIIFALMSNLGITIVAIAVGFYGFRYGPRVQ